MDDISIQQYVHRGILGVFMENEMDKNKNEEKYNKLQWFLMVVVIPALFAFAVAIVVASVAGINVFEKAKEFSGKIPFISSEEKVTDQQNLKKWKVN